METQNGKVQGTAYFSGNGIDKFYTWRHIPYAKPPLGDLRFLVKFQFWKETSATIEICRNLRLL